VTPAGAKSFVVVVNNRWHTIGATDAYSIEDARARARKIIHAVRDGGSPPESFASVAAAWREEHVVRKGLRSVSEVDRHLRRLNDAFAGRDFADVKRIDIANLISGIAKEHGNRQGEYLLQTFRAMANWYARRHDDYASPIVPGMSPRVASACARERILSDDEIRLLWKQEGQSADFAKLLLLTGQREAKVASMEWEDLGVDGVWTIATEPREKGNGGKLALPQAALDIIERQRRFVNNPYIFVAGRGAGYIDSCNAKRRLDAMLGDLPPWCLHDLRRTASSLMARANVREDVGERVLGHKIPGVRGIYNRHAYDIERAQALQALADLIDEVVRG
jgi:integrase